MNVEELSEQQLDERERALFISIPATGETIGNTSLRAKLKWDDALYWGIRKRLLEKGEILLGQGKGGSVRRKHSVAATVGQANAAQGVPQLKTPKSELATYEPIAAALRAEWAHARGYERFRVEIPTAMGAHDTGGIWTRPDIVLVSCTTYVVIPGKVFDVVSFEVKLHKSANVSAIYEALAHLRSTTRAYVVIHLPASEAAAFERTLATIVEEGERHGIGVILWDGTAGKDSCDERVRAHRREPDPEKLDGFLTEQISTEGLAEIARWFK